MADLELRAEPAPRIVKWPPQVRRRLRRLRNTTGSHAALLPLWVLSARPIGTTARIGAHTELVIEGFPRCANTFAAIGIATAQDRPIEIASHVHAPAQVRRAIRLHKPTLLVIREPAACVASLVTARPYLSVDTVLREYISYYERLLTVRDSVTVSDFPQTIGDLSSVVMALNERYALALTRVFSSPDNTTRIFTLIDEEYVATYGRLASIRGLPRPSDTRRSLQVAALKEIGSLKNRPLLESARAIHGVFVHRDS